MPLHDLVHYFNQESARQYGQHAPQPALQQVSDDQVVAHYADLTLESVFQPVFGDEPGRPAGFEALLRARRNLHGDAPREAGQPLPPASIFLLPTNAQEVIYLDRLCRTLHALNFLLQDPAPSQWLSVNIHPRHLTGVLKEHGLVFETILQQLGLSPANVVLEIPATAVSQVTHLEEAVLNYRARGYRITLDGVTPTALATPALAGLRPHIIKLDLRQETPVPALPPVQDSVLAALGVREEQQAALRANGVRLFQGFDLGRPQRTLHQPPSQEHRHAFSA